MHTCDRGLTRLRVQYVVLDRSSPTPDKKYGNATKKNSKGKRNTGTEGRIDERKNACIYDDIYCGIHDNSLHSLRTEWNS